MKQSQWSSRLGYPGRRGFRGRSRRHLEVPLCDRRQRRQCLPLVFLLFSFTLGVAVLMGETLIGSLTRRGVVGAFGELMGRTLALGRRHGALVQPAHLQLLQRGGGWTWATPAWPWRSSLQHGDGAALTARFNDYVGDPLWPVLTHLLFAGLTWWFVQGGVQQGVERTCAG